MPVELPTRPRFSDRIVVQDRRAGELSGLWKRQKPTPKWAIRVGE